LNAQPKDVPSSQRDLAAAVRFLDGFTLQPVELQFFVSIAAGASIPGGAGGWIGSWAPSDATYRFSLANPPTVGGVPQMPTGTVNLAVTTLDGVSLYSQPPSATPPGPYILTVPPQVTLPAASPPSVLASDYLTELPMWPTAAFSVPVGETAVSGWVVSAGAAVVSALRLKLLQQGGPSGEPWATTDGAGQFLVRLPDVKRPAGSNPTVTLTVEMVDQAGATLSVAPSTLTVPVGTVTRFVRLLIP
jgi:hypothetical protein